MIRPSATDITPRQSTSAVATAPSMSTQAAEPGLDPGALDADREPLGAVRCTRSCSKRSVPNALMTCIAESASVASEAISPSLARWLRAICLIRLW